MKLYYLYNSKFLQVVCKIFIQVFFLWGYGTVTCKYEKNS